MSVPIAPLTWRETLVVERVAEGFTNKDIAARLTISVWTVKQYVSSSLGKLGLTNRTQLAAWWWKHREKEA